MTPFASRRRGSALLIVLGLMAFMVVSAVAFSAYMRASRLPSSFLRRTVASRLLVKAALAEAIDELDAAIGNNPHPNVGTQTSTLPRRRSTSGGVRQLTFNRNVWKGRVYIGTNETATIEPRETVPTLTLEGLAYIPPPLVNEARYYSRRSESAKWKALDYEAGRYAFTAIDVSDYFDVNVLQADVARSSDPGRRVSLAYLFENRAHTSASGSMGAPAAWDRFIEKFIGNNKVPLISMADWNLAVHNGGPGGITSPFCTFVENGTASFYGGNPGEERLDELRRLTFVTDSWFPCEEADDVLDLADKENQPFTESVLKGNATFMAAAQSSTKGATRLLQHLPTLGLAMLYDYLDDDRVPVSLGIPSVERVPMITGLEVTCNGATLKVNESAPADVPDYLGVAEPDATTREVTRERTYTLDPSCLGTAPAVKAMVTYPFNHKDEVPASFTVDGALVAFLTTDEMGLRPGNAVNRLKFADNSLFTGNATVGDGVIILPLSERTVAFNNVKKWEDAVNDSLAFVGKPSQLASLLNSQANALLHVKWKWQQTRTINPATGGKTPWAPATPNNQSDVVTAFSGLKALAADGSVDTAFTRSAGTLVDGLESDKPTLTLNVAVVLRVKLNGKTVDMVPACGENDALNGINNWKNPQAKIILGNYLGAATPVMRLNTGASFTCDLAGLQTANTPAQVTLDPQALLIDDPRYNYAPECWVAQTAGKATKAYWHDTFISAKDNDGDIFMSVSDQGYLQSVYELANLPRLCDNGLLSRGDGVVGNLAKPNNWSRKTFVTARNDALNADFMWQTYDPFNRYRDGGDGFERLQFVSDGGATKVNPYSDSTNVIMAAFANTPVDWRCASTNNQEKAFENMSAAQFNAKYAWNGYSSANQLDWQDLEDFAGRFMARMRESGLSGKEYAEPWEVALRNMRWFSNGAAKPESCLTFAETVGGVSFPDLELTADDDLYNVDKKFLYGYWHDSFAAKQQLFLIFVRAEPSMMGAGSASLTSPQLGARAVALVWRDPCTTKNNANPHTTRLLFYRQLD